MEELTLEELLKVSAGIETNIGTAVSALVIGAIAGGVVGLGIAASGVVMAQSVNNLCNMYKNGN